MSNLLAFVLLACSDGEGPPPVFVDDTGSSTGETGTRPPMTESRVRVFAGFRYDATTGLPGIWLDQSSGSSFSAIEILVGDDEYDGVNGQLCRVVIPIAPGEGTPRPAEDLNFRQYWAIDLTSDPALATTNCDQPEFQRIWDFYEGNVVEFMTTNRNGSPARYSFLLEPPSPTAIEWLSGLPSVEAEQVLGADVGVTNRWPNNMSRATSVAAVGYRVDPVGQLLVDSEGENVPVSLLEVQVSSSLPDAVYIFRSYRISVIQNGRL
ncbi:MAG: hypothetical protein AAF211_05460 [Myxococcota bacterium]